VRQNAEIERSKIEIESLITTLSEYSVESGIILKNLMKSNVMTPVNSEYSFAPDLNFKNFFIDKNTLKEKISYLINNVSPKLQSSYFRLTAIQKVPINEDIIGTTNSLNWIIMVWSQHDKIHPSCKFFCAEGFPCWTPEENLYIPPKDPYNLQKIFTERLNEEIKELAEMKKRVINGEFQ